MSFSANLKELLDEREMQIKELSAKTGISKNTIDNYLSGQKSLPNAENAIKIAKALKTSVEFLVTGIQPDIKEQTSPQSKPEQFAKYKKIFSSIQKLDEADLSTLSTLVDNMLRHYKK